MLHWGNLFWGNCANTRWVVCYLNCAMEICTFRAPSSVAVFAQVSRCSSTDWLLITDSRKRADAGRNQNVPWIRIRLVLNCSVRSEPTAGCVRTRKCHFVGGFSSSCTDWEHVSGERNRAERAATWLKHFSCYHFKIGSSVCWAENKNGTNRVTQRFTIRRIAAQQ